MRYELVQVVVSRYMSRAHEGFAAQDAHVQVPLCYSDASEAGVHGLYP
jgi:hypothetical protein